ncbi:MAG: D-xylose ABC transporter ATP-binding protein, partial [Sphaerochaeta sp.]
DKGVAVILISSELPEILGMSDRIVVMHEGYQTAILDAEEATAESVMRYAIATVQMEASNA